MFFGARRPNKEDERGSRVRRKGLVERPQERIDSMKARLMRLLLTLSSVGMIALAGGASLKGF